MAIQISIASTDSAGRIVLGWTPMQATLRFLNGPGPAVSVPAVATSTGSGGGLVLSTSRTHRGGRTLALEIPGDGSPVQFWVAGEFGRPSSDIGDAAIRITDSATGADLGGTIATVRIRKDAQSLAPVERDRFLAAFGMLNARGTGRFRDYRDMHVQSTLGESHGDRGFLPWHRIYLLDLERDLQAIDPIVTLPYWRFDQPAPSIFAAAFMGTPDNVGRLQFTPGHPFFTWQTDGKPGISRTPNFPVALAPPGLIGEQALIRSTSSFEGASPQSGFRFMEGDPHGYAHTSFRGPISNPATAPRDPLFFLLHANVDRLWAKWQWFRRRWSDSDPDAFPLTGVAPAGHNIGDTMWPWNGVVVGTRPPTAPGGALSPSTLTTAPGPAPTVRASLDYGGVLGGPVLGFDYDDVPFEMPDTAAVTG